MNKIALVTGASRGIGAAIARTLARDGWDVALACRTSAEQAEAVAVECRSEGVRAEVFQADLAREEECAALVCAVRQKLGPIRLLVNNAGINRDGLALRMSREQFCGVIEADLIAPFTLCRLCLPDMTKARSGRIVNITSVAGIYGNAGQANYASAKAGLIGLSKTLAKEVGSRGITVNAVAPGLIETEMTAAMPEKILVQAKERIALGRIGKPEDVAALIAFLASDDASYITGQVIEISGGLVL